MIPLMLFRVSVGSEKRAARSLSLPQPLHSTFTIHNSMNAAIFRWACSGLTTTTTTGTSPRDFDPQASLPGFEDASLGNSAEIAWPESRF
eukprot:CAMPEP_0206477750 /NCGR_PEP_ID=MMETSP0324_2-20121206/35610_1 /ASSEMBLY_ACC=CAM_ASM_000836 /TAXON_ID=2866 /ORGANISM="Crypthecodinium cohnii, Strain Seligo" /LENGTH=89 /DNA_ID=CAMNT_0053953857 /DNA_START=270 /DNA_END=539 /DNA_ORIENTATION=+